MTNDTSMAYWEAAHEVLSWPDRRRRVPVPGQVATQINTLLGSRARRFKDGHGGGTPRALAELRRVNAGRSPAGVFATPAAFAEAVAYACCRANGIGAADELDAMRCYLDRALVPSTLPSLLVDCAATREQLSFVTLLMEPHLVDAMRKTFVTFRTAYSKVYSAHHRQHRQEFSRLASGIEKLSTAAHALQRLNMLRRLGPPLAQEALQEFNRGAQHQAACPAGEVSERLESNPTCGYCGVTLQDTVPSDQLDALAYRIEIGLGEQQRRLGSHAVRRILARGGDRLDGFLEIVQAADTASLAQLLDSDLLTFLEELLAQPVPAGLPIPTESRD